AAQPRGPADLGPGWQQAHDRAAADGLARAGLADDGERTARLDRVADAVDGADLPAANCEGDPQVLDFEECPFRVDGWAHRTPQRSRSASPSRFSAMTNISRTMDGMSTYCGVAVRTFCPLAIIAPQLGWGIWMPRPRKSTAPSRMTMMPMPSRLNVMMPGMTFGRTCRKMTFQWPVPDSRAAVMNGDWRTTMVEPRNTRACTGMLKADSAKIRCSSLG